jgi:hypothetical protein
LFPTTQQTTNEVGNEKHCELREHVIGIDDVDPEHDYRYRLPVYL